MTVLFEHASLPQPLTQERLLNLSVVDRRNLVKTLPRTVQSELVSKLPLDGLLAVAKNSVAALETYAVRLKVQERMGHNPGPLHTVELLIRERPFAARAEYVAGPAKGRKLLYDSTHRPDEIRAKEGGLLGFAGALWISVDSALARRDTRHAPTELGFGALVSLLEKDLAAGGGRHGRVDEGFGPDGLFTVTVTAPPGVAGLYATRARIGFDVVSGLPLRVEVEDERGFLERLEYSAPEVRSLPSNAFTPEGAGL